MCGASNIKYCYTDNDLENFECLVLWKLSTINVIESNNKKGKAIVAHVYECMVNFSDQPSFLKSQSV